MSSGEAAGTVEEISIPTSYGFLAAKAWGNKTGFPVLALHGYLDNAGTFDRLIPLLSPALYIVALDAAGHGFSSHKPPGMHYSFRDILLDIKRVVTYLKWNNFSIIGHSFGGAFALLYASVFPDNVLNVVLIDIAKPPSATCIQQIEVTKKLFQSILSFESKLNTVSPVYSVVEARKRLIAGVHNEISEECADVLLKRGSKLSDCGTGVVFTRDIKLKFGDYYERFSHDLLKEYMSKLKCNMLMISAKDSAYKPRSPEVLDDFMNIYKTHCNSFQHIEVNGNHFVHLNKPETIAPHINAFFETHVKKKKSVL